MKTASVHCKKSVRAILLIVLLSTIGMTYAHPVDIQTAREVGVKFLNANTRMDMTRGEDLSLATTYNTVGGTAAFYVFNTTEGFVIVSADDCVTPILGYSDEGRPFDPNNVPIQMQEYLQGFVEQIAFGIENHLEANEQIIRRWELVSTIGRLAENRTNEGVLPLLSTTWGQGCYYNARCPEDPDGSCGHVVTGCVATAMAQVMRYWGYPEHGIGYHSYTPNGYPEQSVDFGATTYDWENMPNSLNESSSAEQIDAVATLMWHCGVSVDMSYGVGGSSGALSPNSLINYFNYSDEISFEDRSWYSEATWKAKLKDCLNLNRPVLYAGWPDEGDGHAFVCDGYDHYDMFHFNWGWSGVGDGFFFIDDLTITYVINYLGITFVADVGGYNYGHIALFNIHPQAETTNYAINVSANNEAGGIVSGGGNFTHGSIVTLSAIANNGYHFCYWEENGGIASTNPNYSFTANFNRNLVAVFAEPFTVTVTATEGGIASGSGSFIYGQSCTVTATADEGYSFANWTRNGEVVSFDANYTFPVTSESLMTAHFVTEENIVFADANVKAICVDNWDSNGDGELSYLEAAMVTSLGDMFSYNTEITSFEELQFFIGLFSIDDYAFYDCSGLTGSLILPNSINRIGKSAFYNCYGLTGPLTIPNSVTAIGSFAFSGCSGFTGSLTIPNSVITIGREAFSGCSGFLGSLTIPNSVRLIKYQAFKACTGFTSLIVLSEIPARVESSSFESISTTIPVYVPLESVEAFQQAYGWNVFSNIIGICSSGTVCVLADPLEGGEVSGGGIYEGGSSCNVVATPNEGYYFVNWTKNNNVVSLDANYTFLVTDNILLTAHFVPEGNIDFADVNVKAICVANWDTNGDNELSYAEAASVRSFGEAFRGNTEITSFEELQFFIGLTSIGDYTFNNCSGLTGPLILPNFIRSIGHFAFEGCNGLTGELTIPNSITIINASTFEGCSGFTGNLTIPNSVTEIGYKAFNGCSGFTGNLVIPNSMTTIGNYAFNNCGGFTGSLTIPNSVIIIGIDAFNNCSGLTGSLTLGNSVTYIGFGAFCYCQGLTGELFIPNTVTSIGDYAFFYCNGLTSLILPNTVPSIGNYAFTGCYGLMSMIVLSELPPSLGTSVFSVSTGIPVYVPCESVEAYQYAVGWSDFTNYIGMCSGNITVAAYPIEGGTVMGGGAYEGGEICTLTAIANEGYSFLYWTEGEIQVSSNSNYSFIVTSDRNLVANFIEGDVCVVNFDFYDSFGDGWTGNMLLVTDDSGSSYELTLEEGSSGTQTLMLVSGSHVTLTWIEGDWMDECSFTVSLSGDIIYHGVNLSSNFMYEFDVNCIGSSNITQTTDFTEGWNWWSPYVEQSTIDGLAMMEVGLGSFGIAIKSQSDGFTEYYDDYDLWYGSLQSINNESSYMVKTIAPCTITLVGQAATPSLHPIPVNANGWTWIGYPVNAALSLDEALAGLASLEGDMLKSREGYAEFYEGYGWFGSLETLLPGMGLMLKSTSTQPTSFTYPSTRSNAVNTNLTSENNHWVPNLTAYPNNMTVTAVVELDNLELSSDGYELAAFANGECRGSVRLKYVEPLNRYVAFLTVAGKNAATLSFTLYDSETGMECFGASESLSFEANATIGRLTEPYVIHFRGTTGSDEWGSLVQVYPNPVAPGERFSISMPMGEKLPVRVEIVNTLGSILSVETSNQLPASIKAPDTAGVYTLRISIEGKGICYRKVVVR